MPLTTIERAWLEKVQEMQNNPDIPGEGVSLRIILYLLDQIVNSREDVAELETRVTNLEGS